MSSEAVELQNKNSQIEVFIDIILECLKVN